MIGKIEKGKLLFISVFVLAIAILINFTLNSTAYAVNYNIDHMFKEVANTVEENYKNRISWCNPYKYVENTIHYNKLIAIGIDALSYIEEELSRAPENSLYGYILCIAIEDIIKSDLKNDNFEWTKSCEFSPVYDKHIKNIEKKVDKILFSSEDKETKKKELVKLGILALPYINEKKNQGIQECDLAYKTLTSQNQLDEKVLPKIESYLKSKK